MPRYFFDLLHGERMMPDTDGLDLHTPAAAEREAFAALADVAKDALPKGGSGATVMRVRGEAGEILLMISFTVAVERPT